MNRKLKLIAALFLVTIFATDLIMAKPTDRELAECKDGSDNDNDGYIDWPDDPGCVTKNDKSELNLEIECDDGTDNDGDNDIDMADGGCSSPTDDDETNCGDSVCEGGETQGNCPEDCGQPDSCDDTDGGNYPFTFGTTSGYYNENPYSNDDYCVDTSQIMEYYCSGDYEQSQQQSCGTDFYGDPYCTGDSIYKDYTDYLCASGECDSDIIPEFQEDCDDSDGYGSNYCEGDNVTKDYYDYYCSGGTCNYTQTPETVVDCNTLDNYGSNYCSYGDVYRDFHDFFCSIASCANTTTPELVDNCTGDEICVEGECIIPDSCSDTDGGLNAFLQGTANGFLNEVWYNDTEYCINSDLLLEFYCIGDYEHNITYNCSLNATTCSNGACL